MLDIILLAIIIGLITGIFIKLNIIIYMMMVGFAFGALIISVIEWARK